MRSLSKDVAAHHLDDIIKQISDSHEPVQITTDANTAVLVAEADWRAIQETLYLLSIPGMRENIRAGLVTPLEECAKEPGW